jgi:hypothetical protein
MYIFKRNKHKCLHDLKRLKINFHVVICTNVDKILNKKVNICATFRTKHGLHKMHPCMVS